MSARDRPVALAVSRREFMVRAGALSVAVCFGEARAAPAAGATTGAPAPMPASPWRPSAWVSIDARGIVTIISAAAEMGQGTMTGLPACLAEEMDADWAMVRVLQAPSDPANFGNPALNGRMATYGDFSTRGYFEKVRLIGAQTRKLLLLNAARTWSAPVDELVTEPGVVLHRASGRRLTFGAIARDAVVPDPLPTVTTADLKAPSDWRLIGKRLPRVDLPDKVNGAAVFGIDVQRPQMLYGAMLYPPVPHEKPVKVNAAAARAIGGVIGIRQFEGCVGVVAETVEAAMNAKAALDVAWSRSAPARSYDTQAVSRDYARIAADPGQKGVAMNTRGDAPAAIAAAARTLSFEYFSSHVAHAAMEPLNATALAQGEEIELWLPTQSPSDVRAACARAAGSREEKVSVHSTLIGGGFGRTSDDSDVAVDAVLLAMTVPGRAVKLTRTREDDFLTDKFRPLTVQRIDVGLDAAGDIVGWRQRIVGASHFARLDPHLLEFFKGQDLVVATNDNTAYGWPNHLVEFVRAERGWDVGPWRGIGAGYTAFATETVLDEIAAIKGMDPLEFRLALLRDQPRAAAVVQAAAAAADWKRARAAGRALGLSFNVLSGGMAAEVAEISLDRERGLIRVHAVWIAIDAGIIVNPELVTAQMEGGTVMGLGPALCEQVRVRNGELQALNYGAYAIPRMSQAPESVTVRLIASDQPPAGVGEMPATLIAPAIANAFARLTGKRLRSLPMSAEQVLQALHA